MDSTSRATTAGMFGKVEMFHHCEQCGRCSSACPITGVDDFNIRRLLRYVELDLVEEIAASSMPWLCTTCAKCEDACPHGIRILDIVRGLRTISPQENLPKPGAPCIDACPAHIDVPGYLRLIAQGKNDEACELIMEKAPLPGILGRVCNRPCEAVCVRGAVNEPVAICAAKRYASDSADALPERVFETEADTGRRVAVIGSGPAGLSAAFFLRKKGHRTTVFEARSKPGGMLRYGIPSYRLPENVLENEIERILSVGVELITGVELGGNLTAEKLREQDFDAVFIAVGAQASKKIPLEGAESGDVLWGLDFLVGVNQGAATDVKDRVVVIGGGSVAVDVAMTAMRLGAKSVVMACLERREEMPANPWEISAAEEERVEILNSWGPNRVIGSNGAVTAIELVRCVSVFDGAGNFAPKFDDTRLTVDAEQVILAIGQKTDLGFCESFHFAGEREGVPVNEGLIAADPVTQATRVEGVFAGGDAVSGPKTIVEAIAAGRRAAIQIDKYLGGDGVVGPNRIKTAAAEEYTGERSPGFAGLRRTEAPLLDLDQRLSSFAEVDLCLTEAQAIDEVNRCFQCDLEHCLVTESKFR